MHTFCNDDDIRGTGFVRTESGVQTADLIDQIAKADYHVCNKMGTSIPNIFARMFLFSSAYNDISSLENKMVDNVRIYKGKAHIVSINPKTNEEYTSVYHHLVSEHLDMLEFLFYYGHEVTFEKWTLKDFEASYDRNDQYDESVSRLARFTDAIKAAIVEDAPVLGGNANMDIILIKYKNVLVGGTSPSLFVFTSPNWKREIAQKGWSFNGLFTNRDPQPLHKRTLPFRKLLTLLAGGNKFNHVNLSDFSDYVTNNRENGYDNQIKIWWNELLNNHGSAPISQWIDDEINKVAEVIVWQDQQDTFHNLTSPIEAIDIYKQSPYHEFKTQYKIRPGRPENHWKTETVHGGTVELMGAPMLIVDGGINGARYYENEFWNPVTTAIPVYSQLKNQYLSNREVPGKNGLKYPILTVDDLLEENIAELPYIVDRENFFTACSEDFNFMLPVKRMYFRFFTFEDLRKYLKIKLIRNMESEITSVSVSLTIPMQNAPGGKYTIERSYSYLAEARFRIVDCRKEKNIFNVGIFPFYKQQRNLSYRFMMGVKLADRIRCMLCNFDKVGFELPAARMQESSELDFTLRSTRDNGAYKTSFATYNGNFDFIEMEIGDEGNTFTGIFIPKMRDIGTGRDYKWSYSVDFGTSNTHIVMANNDEGVVNGAMKFEYDEYSYQMVTFSLSKNNKFQAFESDLQREFVPKILGKDHIVFPIRSVLYERETHGINMELFTERNVGFNHRNELTANFKDNKYISDLKWDIYAQSEFACRINAYCYQLLWMICNHSITNGGTEKIRLAVTYPISMRPTQLRIIKEAWNRAWKELVDSQNDFPQQNFKSESIAPYKYSMDSGKITMNRTDGYLNVDIGGGSTDILYYKEVVNQRVISRAYSIFFAANDLWGNGVRPARRMDKENGFIKNLETMLEDDEIKLERLSNYKRVASNSADVSTYLFSEPEIYHFKDSICQSSIASVVVMHFASLIYYIAKIIKTEGLVVPKYINFTGMGSKYLDIISISSTDIERVIKVIFGLCDIDAGELKVIREDNPKEVTALGALYMLDPQTQKVELPQSKVVYCIDGEDDIDEALTYSDTQKNECMEMTMNEIAKFQRILAAPEFNSVITELGLSYSYETLTGNGLDQDTLESSFISVRDNVNAADEQSMRHRLMDAPFFWALKDTLYVIADNIARSN